MGKTLIFFLSIYLQAQTHTKGTNTRHNGALLVEESSESGESSAYGLQVIKKSEDRREHDEETRELRERIRTLEATIRQMQDEIYRFKTKDFSTENKKSMGYTCLLTTTFDGSFSAKGDTSLEAKAKTMNECRKKDRGYCDVNKIQCEKAE